MELKLWVHVYNSILAQTVPHYFQSVQFSGTVYHLMAAKRKLSQVLTRPCMLLNPMMLVESCKWKFSQMAKNSL
uniref:Stomatal closure-related actin-binding protein 2-like n=1 Tax=Rhizophora mucronata TaxID=61149 RepID=A0A2P2JDK3_RHIMU